MQGGFELSVASTHLRPPRLPEKSRKLRAAPTVKTPFLSQGLNLKELIQALVVYCFDCSLRFRQSAKCNLAPLAVVAYSENASSFACPWLSHVTPHGNHGGRRNRNGK